MQTLLTVSGAPGFLSQVCPSCSLSLTATVGEPCGITLQHDSQVGPGIKATQPGGRPEDHSAAGRSEGTGGEDPVSSVPVRSPDCSFSAVPARLFLPITSPARPSAQPPSLSGSRLCVCTCRARPGQQLSSWVRGCRRCFPESPTTGRAGPPGVNKPADTAPSPTQPECQALPVKELEDTQC